MQFSPQQQKEKLLRAIGADNNEVDMQLALEVISTLEKQHVSREALEQYRIGKLVNDLRKKTTDKELAKRAKKLVRKWQDLINSTTPSASNAAVNGERVTGNGGGRPDGNSLPPHMQRHGSKPASPASRPGTPSSNKSTVSPTSLQYAASTPSSSRPDTPLSGLPPRLSPRLAGPRQVSPLVGTPSSSKNGHSPSITLRLERSTASCEVNRPGTPTETLSKGNVANKRKRRGLDLEETPNRSAKHPSISDSSGRLQKLNNNSDGLKNREAGIVLNGAMAGDHTPKSANSRWNTSQSGVKTDLGAHQVSPVNKSEPSGAGTLMETPQKSLAERRNASFCVHTDSMCESASGDHGHLERTPSSASLGRTPKVKTTAQLIQDLHNSVGMRLSGSETVTKIAMNQIEKEPDLISDSVVPPEAKPRFRRKPGTTPSIAPPPASDNSLSRTKSEMMQKFLESSVSSDAVPSVDSEGNLMDLIKQDDERIASLVPVPDDEDSRQSFVSVPSRDSIVDQPTLKPVITDPWSLLPPLDLDNIKLEEEVYEVPEQQPVTEEDVDRLENEHVPGVNGFFDHENNWHDWAQTFSLPSVNGDLLHILPYVDLTD